MIYWLTGQPGSGKSTLSMALKSALRARGHAVVHLDGEFLRDVTDNRDFSLAGRMRNIKAGQQLAAKLHADGIVVVASFVSPYRNLREEFKRKGDVVEIYLHTKEMRREGTLLCRRIRIPAGALCRYRYDQDFSAGVY